MRWDCSIPCTLRSNGERSEGRIINLSFNGACLDGSPLNAAQGDTVAIKFSAQGEDVRIQGRIVYLSGEDSGERVGIEFDGSWKEKVAKVMPVFRLFIEKNEVFTHLP